MRLREAPFKFTLPPFGHCPSCWLLFSSFGICICQLCISWQISKLQMWRNINVHFDKILAKCQLNVSLHVIAASSLTFKKWRPTDEGTLCKWGVIEVSALALPVLALSCPALPKSVLPCPALPYQDIQNLTILAHSNILAHFSIHSSSPSVHLTISPKRIPVWISVW